MRIFGIEERIHIINNEITVEEIMKDIVRTKVTITNFIILIH